MWHLGLPRVVSFDFSPPRSSCSLSNQPLGVCLGAYSPPLIVSPLTDCDPFGLSRLTGVRDGWNSFYPSGANYVLPLLSSLLVLIQICCLCSEDISGKRYLGVRGCTVLLTKDFLSHQIVFMWGKLKLLWIIFSHYIKVFLLGEVLCEAWLMAL